METLSARRTLRRGVKDREEHEADRGVTKLVDRDVNGSINIGLLWLSDNVSGRERPEVFKRRSPKKSAASQVASSHIPLKTAGEGRKRPYIKQNNGLVTVRVSHLVQ